jgi:proline dehydrogenase
MQDAADDLVTQMMQKYNKEKAIVSILYKCTVGIDWILKIYTKSKIEGFFIGMKLVCGAYMEKENERAHASGYQPDLRF